MYKSYHEYWYLMIIAKRDLEKLQFEVDSILSELTKATTEFREVTTMNSSVSEKMTKLIASKLELEEIIKYQKQLVESRKERVELKLEDLKKSKDIEDIIYYLKFVSKFKTTEVAKVVCYTREYTYDLISKIRENLKRIEHEVEDSLKQGIIPKF